MVNVDPFDLSKYQEINQEAPFDLSTHHLDEISSPRDGDSVPAFTIQILPEYDQENISREVTPSSSGVHKHPLTENRTNIISHPPPPPLDPEKTQDSVTKLSRKKYFKDEKLVLECEWDDCDESFDRVAEFVEHVSRHVTEAEVRGPSGAEDDMVEVFGCLWAECGFETPASEEMVRHVNFTGNIRLPVNPLNMGHELVLGPGKATCRAREQGIFGIGGARF